MESVETTISESSENNNDKPKVTSNLDYDKSKGEFVWTLQATWQLVRTRLSMDAEFDQPVCKKKQLWETVAERVTANLQEAGNPGSTVKAYECDLKWRNMLATYRKNAERARRLGAQSVHWEFFPAMHDVLGRSGEEAKVQRKSKPHTQKLGPSPASKRFTPILPTPALSLAPQSPRPSQDVLHLYLELQERKMNLWMQQKALEERKIEAINNLARAISSLAEDARLQLPKEAR
ncbi:uncharacterized protein si:dkey-66i24.7 [Brienomyrus brachyistius]|uniref:uncharacterized protein si:dkey-66i24.7 n=1 Tax=Brienomyrus brachyistius TaxID=42636 RepID=UPI0020B42A40|nr:uncharacterized protein si:dkey-66i24.7 [Brienomyrus brachyistius]